MNDAETFRVRFGSTSRPEEPNPSAERIGLHAQIMPRHLRHSAGRSGSLTRDEQNTLALPGFAWRASSTGGPPACLAVMRATYRDEALAEPMTGWWIRAKWVLRKYPGFWPAPVRARRRAANPLHRRSISIRRLQFKLVIPNLNLDEFIRRNRIAEIGRFAVDPQQQGNLLVSAALLRTALGRRGSRIHPLHHRRL